ncbi:SH3 domain-containing protein [Mesorhizobium delmotii]|uniref:Uncharacterized protein n=1 Tax=Mesorhizobium delmotii TaxID=1631247 RepID=A0A2P9AL70_9HYPH|nr:SH3 domain-containing protein [Mesorhizobium delmotii]SJM31883.1 hypothetical protein BQ8482_220054 [Mesorhizobium delmotii]
MASGEGRDHAASVRAGPSAGYARIAKLPIEVEACRARWCLIDRGDVEGWVSAKLIGRYRPVQDTTVIVEIVPRMPRWRGPGQVMGPGLVRSPNFNPPNLPGGFGPPANPGARSRTAAYGPIRGLTPPTRSVAASMAMAIYGAIRPWATSELRPSPARLQAPMPVSLSDEIWRRRAFERHWEGEATRAGRAAGRRVAGGAIGRLGKIPARRPIFASPRRTAACPLPFAHYRTDGAPFEQAEEHRQRCDHDHRESEKEKLPQAK